MIILFKIIFFFSSNIYAIYFAIYIYGSADIVFQEVINYMSTSPTMFLDFTFSLFFLVFQLMMGIVFFVASTD